MIFFFTNYAVNIANIVDPRSLHRHGNGYHKIKKYCSVNHIIWGCDYANIVDIHSTISVSKLLMASCPKRIMEQYRPESKNVTVWLWNCEHFYAYIQKAAEALAQQVIQVYLLSKKKSLFIVITEHNINDYFKRDSPLRNLWGRGKITYISENYQ